MLSLKQIKSGYTLLEIMVALMIMAVVAGSVVHVSYSTNADRLSGAVVFKNVLEQIREVAIANNGSIQVDLNGEKLSVEVVTLSDGGTTTSDLAHVVGLVPQELGAFEVALSHFAPQLEGVSVSGATGDSTKLNSFQFGETGSLDLNEDLFITLESSRFSDPVILKVNGFTGLIELQ